MRILAIAPTGFFAEYGCHVRIMGQLRALQGLGYDIRLVTYPAGRDIAGLPTVRPPVPFLRQIPVGSSWRKIALDSLLAPTAFASALAFRPQLIHTYLHEGALLGAFLARFLGVPLTFDYQGSLTAEMIDHNFISGGSWTLPWLRRLEAWIERQPDAIFPSSLRAQDLLQKRHASHLRLHHLPDCIDPSQFAPQPPDPHLYLQIGLDPDRPVVVYLGLLAPYQGTDLLLQAIAQPALSATSAQFLIMGFPQVEHYRAMAQRLGISHSVHFTGAIPYAQAQRYLALGHVAVAPKLSATEGSGKLLPYMSMGLPIVATDTPVHRQYLGEDGVLVPSQPVALAEAIAGVLARLSEYENSRRRVRSLVENHYTWQQSALTMANVFREQIDSRLVQSVL